ncbi:hypothetical protein Rifp1Sym_fs00020 [endosymbiont of Riftia pachyptila (vent Ph05)]|uniref:Uncharacterized protein n=1 Tax=endosymbiont of Riftia pachyptila (vent Ph05) TaxID=1048808 RepID=G2DHS3_9GAMM|nr:hypothetical protein Rifp1Sym_fs00020 [endosymbiont of Riftia pachyptila (vent Ph05)]
MGDGSEVALLEELKQRFPIMQVAHPGAGWCRLSQYDASQRYRQQSAPSRAMKAGRLTPTPAR